MKTAVIFGATDTGKRIYEEVKGQYHIVGFVDGNPELWGSKIDGIEIYDYKKLENWEMDFVIIGVLASARECKSKVLALGIPEYKVIDQYVEFPIKSRIECLKNLSEVIYENKIEGAVAEVGVYRGAFARYINEYFPDRDFYMFDTFEGLPGINIETDQEKGYTGVKEGHFSDTSVSFVLEKMPHRERCKVFKGYFPQTAEGLDEKFCFVNLDADLYEPTLEGLKYFYPRMCGGGSC